MVNLQTNTMRLEIKQAADENFYVTTSIKHGEMWQQCSTVGSRPIDAWIPTTAGDDFLSGEGEGYRWRTAIKPLAGGFYFDTTLVVTETVRLNPSMILWVGALDNMDDRQAHTWRQTIVRAPTTNQQGLGGNDLPACYLYDHATHTETICYFPPERFAWAEHRFYHFAMREVLSYRPHGRYGVGLIPNSPDVMFTFPPGEHHLSWWFTQAHRAEVPTAWEAQQHLIETVTPLLNPLPSQHPDALSWHEMASRAYQDLQNPACWISIDGHEGLRAYVRGSSSVGRDEAQGFELMTQLDVLWPLLLWQQATGTPDSAGIVERLERTLPLFERSAYHFVANNFPPHAADTFMDTWYFLENALIKLPWVAFLQKSEPLKRLFFTALEGARTLAHQTNYLFPLFADAGDWCPRNSLLNVSVGGLYAAGCVIAYQLDKQPHYLDEAAKALLTLHHLPPHLLMHEPQQLSYAAAAANYLAPRRFSRDWKKIAGDFVHLSLRMGYWGQDAAVDFYDPRGMFQACASLCYPAFKENVETIAPWAELIRHEVGPISVMAAFANLQRCHNYAFFDPYLPEHKRRGPCAYIPYEDIATAEFSHTAELGKELYGAGEVFWSALMFDALGRVDDPDVLCLCLDIPSVELRPIPDACRFLLYNPTYEARDVNLHHRNSAVNVSIPSQAFIVVDPT